MKNIKDLSFMQVEEMVEERIVKDIKKKTGRKDVEIKYWEEVSDVCLKITLKNAKGKLVKRFYYFEEGVLYTLNGSTKNIVE